MDHHEVVAATVGDLVTHQIAVVHDDAGGQARVHPSPSRHSDVRALGGVLDLPAVMQRRAGETQHAAESVSEAWCVVHRWEAVAALGRR
jgi:hypothetical protein